MEADPFAQPNANCRNLVLGLFPIRHQRFVVPLYPDADAAVADVASDVELIQRQDHPAFQLTHKAAHVAPSFGNIQHDIDHALTWPVIGVLPAAFAGVDRETVGIGQILALG